MTDVTSFFANENEYADIDAEGAAARLSSAIRCYTVNDRHDYAGFDALQAHMRASYPHIMAEGSFELVGHSVLITLPGRDPSLRPALFMSHQDVVPVVKGTESDWTHGAFSGDIADGYIWGRGTLDIKEMVFGILEAGEYLLAHGEKFRRTVYFAFGEDEETFNTGAQAISDLLKSRGVTLEFVLDEGGGKIHPGSAFGAPNVNVSEINLMEKGYADLRLRAYSVGGHSSRPFGGTSLARLSCAIASIVSSPFPAECSPVLRKTFETLAPYISEEPVASFVSSGDWQGLADYCLTVPELFPLVTTTIAPTMINGGSQACNVMPQNMEAVVNFRIGCGHTAKAVFEHCRALVEPDIDMDFLQANDPSAVANTDSFGYESLCRVMGHYFSGVVFIPTLTVGGTDAHCYEQICDVCLRCSPFVGNIEDVETGVHGTNERISVRAYIHGIRVLIGMMKNTCIDI